MPAMHEIDYNIYGDDMQFVEVELDPSEAVVAEAGGMMFMDDGIQMETIFGDGSQQNSGLLGALLGAGKRRVAFAAPYPAKIIPVHLAELGGELLAQKDSFLCAAKGVSIGIAFTKRLGAGFFGGEGLFFTTLRGPGKVWLQSLPLSRLAGRIVAAVPGLGRGGREEGSLLGGLGRIIDGDNS